MGGGQFLNYSPFNPSHTFFNGTALTYNKLNTCPAELLDVT